MTTGITRVDIGRFSGVNGAIRHARQSGRKNAQFIAVVSNDHETFTFTFRINDSGRAFDCDRINS